MSDVLKPNAALLCKLGSIAVHVDELLSPAGHQFDREALRTLLDDPAVTEWLQGMGEMALIPLKRSLP
jgi:hypothetical protein